MAQRQAFEPGAEICGRGGVAVGVPGFPVSGPTAAPSLPAAAGAVQALFQRHAFEFHQEVGDRREHRGGGGAAGRHLLSVMSPVSGGGADFAGHARGQEAVAAAAAQEVPLGGCLDQVGPPVVQLDGQDVELPAPHGPLQAVLARRRRSDAGERCVLTVLHLLEADVVAIVQEGPHGNGVAELFMLACSPEGP